MQWEALYSLNLRTTRDAVWGVPMYAGVSTAHMDFANFAQKPNTLLAWLFPQESPPGLELISIGLITEGL